MQLSQIILGETTLKPVRVDANGVATFRNTTQQQLALAEGLSVSCVFKTPANNSKGKLNLVIPTTVGNEVKVCRASVDITYPAGHSSKDRAKVKELLVAALQNELLQSPLFDLESLF